MSKEEAIAGSILTFIKTEKRSVPDIRCDPIEEDMLHNYLYYWFTSKKREELLQHVIDFDEERRGRG